MKNYSFVTEGISSKTALVGAGLAAGAIAVGSVITYKLKKKFSELRNTIRKSDEAIAQLKKTIESNDSRLRKVESYIKDSNNYNVGYSIASELNNIIKQTEAKVADCNRMVSIAKSELKSCDDKIADCIKELNSASEKNASNHGDLVNKLKNLVIDKQYAESDLKLEQNILLQQKINCLDTRST